MIGLDVLGMTVASARYDTTGSETAAKAMFALVFMCGVSYSVAWGGRLYNYAVGLFPYNIRAKGFVLVFWIQSVFLSINTYVDPISEKMTIVQ